MTAQDAGAWGVAALGVVLTAIPDTTSFGIAVLLILIGYVALNMEQAGLFA